MIMKRVQDTQVQAQSKIYEKESNGPLSEDYCLFRVRGTGRADPAEKRQRLLASNDEI